MFNFNTRVAPACRALGKVAVAALLAVSASAQATVLFDSVDNQATSQHASLSFFATDPITTISFSGYNRDVATLVYYISLQLNGVGSNLISWSFSPAPTGSGAYTKDGSTLEFYGVTIGSYDTFSQSISLNTGSNYQLDFDYDIYGYTNGLRVETNGSLTAPMVAAPVPEPETYAMMLAGLAGLGAMSRRKRSAK
jgi:hypothetical protein